ncbi:MAG: outer membrane beta-barrel protein [Bacteriovoracaceae bacterium]
MKRILMVSSLVLVCSGAVEAQDKPSAGGLFVEPMLTYEKGEGEIDYPSPINSSSNDIDGFGVGARVGVHIYESLFIGADGRYSMPNFKDSSLNQDVKAKSFNYGPVVGFQMPTTIGLRVWGGYILGGELDPEKDQNVDAKFKEAKGYRVGAGIKLGITSLNLEYQDIKYDKTEIQEVGVFTPGSSYSNVNLENQSWILSVSFPIAI